MPNRETSFTPTSHRHAALAQLHRWYQIYEDLPNAPAHYEILSEDIVVDAASGVVEGLAKLKPRFSNYAGWDNAHHVVDAEVKRVGEAALELTADIFYSNVMPNGQRTNVTVHYEATMRENVGALPVFTKIKMRPAAARPESPFVSRYTENRARSFMHHWLLWMEIGKGNADHFRPLLALEFAVDLGGAEPATTWEQFEAWFKTVPHWLADSAHRVEDLEVGQTPEGLITLKMNFDWHGTHIDGSPMIARTDHVWHLEPNLGQPFAAMKRMQVKQLVPFQKVT